MNNLIKSKKFWLIFFGILVVVIAVLYVLVPGKFRQVGLAVQTEFRVVLLRHGPPPQIRFDWRTGENQIYIPAGAFVMGSNNGAGLTQNKAHKVYLDAYWIDQVEVTNAMYAICVQAGSCTHPARYNNYYDDSKYADYPVVYVTWYAAETFCEWNNGKLPTEAQWEKAARGTDERRFPWGNTPTDSYLLNFNGQFKEPTSSYDYMVGMSPYGLLNLAGNVREWIWDWYDPDYYSVSPYRNPKGPLTGVNKSLRGGAFYDNSQQVQAFFRENHDPKSAGMNRGLRCVYNGN